MHCLNRIIPVQISKEIHNMLVDRLPEFDSFSLSFLNATLIIESPAKMTHKSKMSHRFDWWHRSLMCVLLVLTSAFSESIHHVVIAAVKRMLKKDTLAFKMHSKPSDALSLDRTVSVVISPISKSIDQFYMPKINHI